MINNRGFLPRHEGISKPLSEEYFTIMLKRVDEEFLGNLLQKICVFDDFNSIKNVNLGTVMQLNLPGFNFKSKCDWNDFYFKMRNSFGLDPKSINTGVIQKLQSCTLGDLYKHFYNEMLQVEKSKPVSKREVVHEQRSINELDPRVRFLGYQQKVY